MGKVVDSYGFTKIVQLRDGSLDKIINVPGDPYSIHVHYHPGGITISTYDKATGKPLTNFDGTPQRFDISKK